MKKNVLVLVLALSLIITGCQAPAKSEAPKTEAPKAEAPKIEVPKKEVTAAEVMQNKNARLAIAYAIDKSYLEDTIVNDGSKASNAFVTKGTAVDSTGADFRAKYPDGFLQYDVAKAKEHWAKAKQELGFDKVSISFLSYDTESAKKISEYIQGQLKTNLEGLDVVLNVQPFQNKIKISEEGKFDMEIAGWGPPYADAMAFLDMFLPDTSLNTAGYREKDYQDIVQSAKTGELLKDVKKRWEALQDAEKLLVERDACVVPLFQIGRSYLHRLEVKGIVERPLQSNYYAYATTDKKTDGKSLLRFTSTSDLPTLNTGKASDTVSFEVLSNCVEGLVWVDEKSNVAPRLAEKWEVSEDGLKYVFHLKKGALWSDGKTPVTAHDFEFAWKYFADPANGSTFQYMAETACLKNAVKLTKKEVPASELGVKAIDDYTLQVELDAPVPFFMKLMALPTFYPINEKFYNEHKDTFGTTIKDTLYNGPYMMTKMESGYSFQYERNPHYYDAKNVKNDGVTVRVVKDTAAAVNLYTNGEIDRTPLSGEYVTQYMDKPDYLPILTASIRYLVFNQYNR